MRARSPFYDKILPKSALLNGKATQIESFLQSIIFTPKNFIKMFAFLFVLTVQYGTIQINFISPRYKLQVKPRKQAILSCSEWDIQ